jgi:hypothetical protein
MQQQRRQSIHERWAQRHKALAAEERALRKDQVAAARDFGHKRNGTIETHQKASRTRQGAMARLYEAGHLTPEQLAGSQAIRAVAERIGADVRIGTVSLETRVDHGRPHDAGFFEALGAVRAEVAFGRWRRALGGAAWIVLAMIVEDLGPAPIGKRFGRRPETCRTLLQQALDLWSRFIGEVCDEIDEPTLAAAQAGIL